KPVEVVIDTTKVVSFLDDIIPIFDNSCNYAGCHSAGHFKVDLTPANAYTDIFAKNMVDTLNPETSLLYSHLMGATHNNRATATEKEYILKWIKEGAKNN
ncbi:hypothetical protein ACFLQ5_03990, partial [Bacteroidota bacterium]